MRRAGAAVLAAVLALTLAGCGRQDRPQSGKLNVVCTLFPYYDFVRQIGGDAVDVQLLVPAGRETHSFEPTPLDVIAVSEAEVFIYNGGESELWVEDILDAAGEAIPYRLAMMDCVETYREEYARGCRAAMTTHMTNMASTMTMRRMTAICTTATRRTSSTTSTSGHRR